MANTDKAASVIIHTIGQGDATAGSFAARITSLSGPINTDVKFNCVIL